MAIVVASGCSQAPSDASRAFPGATDGIDTGTSVDNATPADEDAGVADPGPAAPPANPASCEDEAQRAADVLAQRCAGCHANGQRNGGFGDALNLEAIVTKGLVVLGDLPGSVLYRVTANGSMPRNASNLTVDEQRALADWILCQDDPNGTPVDDGVGPGDPGGGSLNPPDDDDDLDDDDDDDDDVDRDDDGDEAIDEAADRDEDSDEDADEASDEAADND